MKFGIASTQTILQFLNLEKKEAELARIKKDTQVADAKIKKMEFEQNSEELYEKAIEAMKRYSGYAEHYNCDDDNVDDEW